MNHNMFHQKEPLQAVSVIIVAAGRSTRMQGIDKQFVPLLEQPLLAYSVRAFFSIPAVCEIILVLGEHNLEQGRALMARIMQEGHAPLPYRVVCGGATRQSSSQKGFSATRPDSRWIAIHDGARPLVRSAEILAVIADAQRVGAATLGIPIKDTLRRLASDSPQSETVSRTDLFAIQTPQIFRRDLYEAGLVATSTANTDCTDDAGMIEQLGHPVQITPGDERNLKVTTPHDLALAAFYLAQEPDASDKTENTDQKKTTLDMRIGHGYDVHRLVVGRALVLGGVTIPHEMGLLGHSDADVLIHAVIDALLGAAGLGDIGQHFPDTDDAYQGADSIVLLQQVICLLRSHGYEIGNIDATIVAQAPKLAPFLPAMVERIAAASNLLPTQVNVKATTEERLGFTGDLQGMSATAVALLQRQSEEQ